MAKNKKRKDGISISNQHKSADGNWGIYLRNAAIRKETELMEHRRKEFSIRHPKSKR